MICSINRQAAGAKIGSWRALIMGLAVIAFSAMMIATPWGLGLSSDSLVYVGTARRISSGHGFTYLTDAGEFSPVNHYPPLYPAVMAALTRFGPDSLKAARWMNAVLFAANVVVIGGIAFGVTSSPGAGLMAGFLAFSSFPMVQIHSMAWSEPLFIFLTLLGVISLVVYVERSQRWMLCASGLSIGLSCLARYAGIAWILSGAVGVLSECRAKRKERVRDAVIFVSLGSLPLLMWAWRNSVFAGSAANRGVGFHPFGAEALLTALDSFCLWVFPAGIVFVPVWMRLIALAAFVLAILRFSSAEVLHRPPVRVARVFLLGYVVFIALARCCFDSAINFDTRIMAPAYLGAMILAIALTVPNLRMPAFESRSPSRLALFCLLASASAMQMTSGLMWWKRSYQDGIGFAQTDWRDSELLRFVDAADSSAAVFTNLPDVIYMLKGRQTAMIPRKFDPTSRLPNNKYAVEITRMRQELNRTHGAVVYFLADQRLWYLPSDRELQKDAGLFLVETKKDGFIYRAN